MKNLDSKILAIAGAVIVVALGLSIASAQAKVIRPPSVFDPIWLRCVVNGDNAFVTNTTSAKVPKGTRYHLLGTLANGNVVDKSDILDMDLAVNAVFIPPISADHWLSCRAQIPHPPLVISP